MSNIIQFNADVIGFSTVRIIVNEIGTSFIKGKSKQDNQMFSFVSFQYSDALGSMCVRGMEEELKVHSSKNQVCECSL